MRMWRALGTEWLLEQWGAWARMPEGARLSYPSVSNFAKYQGGGIKEPEIELELALAVDRIVKLTSLVNEDFELALCERFVRRRTQEKIARSLGMPRTEAVNTLNRAVAWVDGYLHSVAHMLEQELSSSIDNVA